MDRRNVFRVFERFWTGITRGIDVPLAVAILLLCAISIINLYGIGGADHTLFRRQLVLVGVGMILAVVLSRASYRSLKDSTVPVLALYGISTALLLATLFFPQIRNIRAWVSIAGFQFEPSELAKLALVILMAKYFSQRHVHIRQMRHMVVSGLYCALPALIILTQPDLGSAAIIMIVWVAMLVSVGVRARHLFLLGIVGLVGIYLAWIYALAPYQKDRILAFIDPYQDPTGYGYHIIQSQTAIGSGGLFGRGLGQGSQATLGFLPEPYNDFAFAALVEQFGLLGALTTLGLVGCVVWRILVIGRQSGNNFARLFCIGTATVVFAHIFVSAAVNIGLLPITGIPMTFISYGGSHLWSMLAAFGIVQSIARHG